MGQNPTGSDRDKIAESRDRAAELRDRGAESRDEQSRHESRTEGGRDKLTSDQDQAWSDDDKAASRSDQRSADADQRAADDDFAAGGDAVRHRRGGAARAESKRNRSSVSLSRDETTTARLREHVNDGDPGRADVLLPGGRDRRRAADDREDAAVDRKAAARERAEALVDSTASADAARRALETLEAMSDAFFTLDSEWRFTYLNPQCEALLQRGRAGLIGRSVWAEFPEAVGSLFEQEYRRAIAEGVPVRFEQAYEPLGRTFEVRAHPVTAGLAVYFTDVTDERRRDARLQQTERLEMLGRVTAGVAHDFNNLLAAVGGFAQLGQADAVDETTTGYFDQIYSATQKAAALTGQLLAFARQQDLSPAALDLNDVVEGISSLLRQLLPPGIALRLAPAAQPVTVFVDRTQLEQVVLNLVVNSRDAIDGTGTITISTTCDAPAGLVHEVGVASGWLQVTDTGSGIPEDVRPHIFDPFFSTKPPETGTGLGLATIYGIVTQSGGAIFVDSTVGVGTTLTIALPADQPAPA